MFTNHDRATTRVKPDQIQPHCFKWLIYGKKKNELAQSSVVLRYLEDVNAEPQEGLDPIDQDFS